jgi:hypothetical protein
MKATTLKGLIHAALALGAVVEAMTTNSKFRRVLSGAAAGYHAHAALYHFMFEKEEPTWEEGTNGFDTEDYEEGIQLDS